MAQIMTREEFDRIQAQRAKNEQAERGQVVWCGRVWLEKRTAARTLEQAA